MTQTASALKTYRVPAVLQNQAHCPSTLNNLKHLSHGSPASPWCSCPLARALKQAIKTRRTPGPSRSLTPRMLHKIRSSRLFPTPLRLLSGWIENKGMQNLATPSYHMSHSHLGNTENLVHENQPAYTIWTQIIDGGCGWVLALLGLKSIFTSKFQIKPQVQHTKRRSCNCYVLFAVMSAR